MKKSKMLLRLLRVSVASKTTMGYQRKWLHVQFFTQIYEVKRLTTFRYRFLMRCYISDVKHCCLSWTIADTNRIRGCYLPPA